MYPYSVARGHIRSQMEKRAQRSRLEAQRGEKIMSAVMPYRGYGWRDGQDPYVQIQHLKNWTGVGIDLLASLCAQLVPNIAYVRPQRKPGKTEKWFSHDYKRIQNLSFGSQSFLSGTYQRKALGVIKPHEEIEPVEENHPLRRLIEQPNAWDTQYDHDYELVMFQYLCGVAYDWAVPHNNGSGPFGNYPRELWCIPTPWVWPMSGNGEVVSPDNPYADHIVSYYQIWPYGAVGGAGGFKLPPDQVVRYAFKSPINKVSGYAKTFMGRNWIDADDSIAKSQFAQMSNVAMPSFWLELGEGYEDPTDDQIDRIGAKFMQRYQGELNMGRPFIGPPGTIPHPLSFPPQQMAYGEAMDQSRDRILCLLGVPKSALGLNDNMTFGSVIGTLFGFSTFTLKKLLTQNGQTKTKFLATKFSTPDNPLRIWYDDPSPVDPDQLNKDLTADFASGTITPNEWRAIRGRAPYEHGGDDPLVAGPGGLVPLPINTGEDLTDLADLMPLLGRQENPAALEEESEDGTMNPKVDEPNGPPKKRAKGWSEQEHPRNEGGEFGPKNGLPAEEANVNYADPNFDKNPLNQAMTAAENTLRQDFFDDPAKTAANVQACVDSALARNRTALKGLPEDKVVFLESWMNRQAQVLKKPAADLADKAKALREYEQTLEAHEAAEPKEPADPDPNDEAAVEAFDDVYAAYQEELETWSDTKETMQTKLEKLNNKADDARERFLDKLDAFNFDFSDRVMEMRAKAPRKDFNPNQSRADDGKFGSGSSAESGKTNPATLADKAKKLSRAVYTRAANKVKSTYTKLEGRYGKKTALAVMGAGILGLPLPVPGSSLLTAAPILVAAELYLKFSGSKEAAPLSQEEIDRLGKRFIADLLAGWDEGPKSGLPKLCLNGVRK